MIAALKSEMRKLLTVRSTYGWVLVAYAFLIFIALYGEGYKGAAAAISGQYDKLALAGSISTHSNLLSIFGAIVALLLMTHEFRYNTIMYTITASKSRSTVLLSKITTIFIFIALYVLVGDAIGFGSIIYGFHLAGQSLQHQDISLLTYYGKSLFFCEGWAMAALLLATVLRNQVAALVVLLVVPNSAEGLLSLVLKNHSVYMPFMALSQVIQPPVIAGAVAKHPETAAAGVLSPLKGALVFGLYLVVGWIVGWILFLRRDAN